MLTIAVSSRALFNMDCSHDIFVTQGKDAYNTHMRENEFTPFSEGPAFNLVKKLLALNTPGLPKRDRVEVILLSRNSPDAGIRVMNSAKHHNLNIESAVFSPGNKRFNYVAALGAHLFLSTNEEDVQLAVQNGLAAATMPTTKNHTNHCNDDVVRIAFDGDSVLFSDESDQYFLEHGLDLFRQNEEQQSNVPMKAGPFKHFLKELSNLQKTYPSDELPIKIALVTARGAPAHERVLKTLRSWDISLDEAIFAGGAPKGPLLKAFGADIFFDDTKKHIVNAALHDVTAGHVPYGIGMGGINYSSRKEMPPENVSDHEVIKINEVAQISKSRHKP